jgi:hypothetical protein
MTCNSARELLPLFVGGDLTAPRMDEVRAHMGQCPSCAAELSRFEGCRELLAELNAPELPRDQVHRMWAAIRETLPVAPRAPIRFSSWLRMAAVVLVGVAVGYTATSLAGAAGSSDSDAWRPASLEKPSDLDPGSIKPIAQPPEPRGISSNSNPMRAELMVRKLEEELMQVRRQIVELQAQNEALTRRLIELQEKK